MTEEEKSHICLECQMCCKVIGFVASSKTDYSNGVSEESNPSQDLVEYMRNWGYEIKQINETEYAAILYKPCQHLTDKGCNMYDTRPLFCRNYWACDDPALSHLCKLPKEKEAHV